MRSPATATASATGARAGEHRAIDHDEVGARRLREHRAGPATPIAAASAVSTAARTIHGLSTIDVTAPPGRGSRGVNSASGRILPASGRDISSRSCAESARIAATAPSRDVSVTEPFTSPPDRGSLAAAPHPPSPRRIAGDQRPDLRRRRPDTLHEALAVRGDRIVAVGRAADLERLRGAATNSSTPGSQRRTRLQRHAPAPVRRRARRRTRRPGRRRHRRGGAVPAAGVRGRTSAAPWVLGEGWGYNTFPGACRPGPSSMPRCPISRPSCAASTTTPPGSTRRPWRWPGSPGTLLIR